MGKWQMKLLCKVLVISLLCGALLYNTSADAEDPELPPLAKMRDANKNNRIERNEAAGPLVGNFDTMDCDKSNNLASFKGLIVPRRIFLIHLPKNLAPLDHQMNYFLISIYPGLYRCSPILLNHGPMQ